MLTSGKATHERQTLGSTWLLDLFSNCEGACMKPKTCCFEEALVMMGVLGSRSPSLVTPPPHPTPHPRFERVDDMWCDTPLCGEVGLSVSDDTTSHTTGWGDHPMQAQTNQ